MEEEVVTDVYFAESVNVLAQDGSFLQLPNLRQVHGGELLYHPVQRNGSFLLRYGLLGGQSPSRSQLCSTSHSFFKSYQGIIDYINPELTSLKCYRDHDRTPEITTRCMYEISVLRRLRDESARNKCIRYDDCLRNIISASVREYYVSTELSYYMYRPPQLNGPDNYTPPEAVASPTLRDFVTFARSGLGDTHELCLPYCILFVDKILEGLHGLHHGSDVNGFRVAHMHLTLDEIILHTLAENVDNTYAQQHVMNRHQGMPRDVRFIDFECAVSNTGNSLSYVPCYITSTPIQVLNLLSSAPPPSTPARPPPPTRFSGTDSTMNAATTIASFPYPSQGHGDRTQISPYQSPQHVVTASSTARGPTSAHSGYLRPHLLLSAGGAHVPPPEGLCGILSFSFEHVIAEAPFYLQSSLLHSLNGSVFQQPTLARTYLPQAKDFWDLGQALFEMFTAFTLKQCFGPIVVDQHYMQTRRMVSGHPEPISENVDAEMMEIHVNRVFPALFTSNAYSIERDGQRRCLRTLYHLSAASGNVYRLMEDPRYDSLCRIIVHALNPIACRRAELLWPEAQSFRRSIVPSFEEEIRSKVEFTTGILQDLMSLDR